MNETRLREELVRLQRELEEHRKRLPAHSVRAHQVLAIEKIEERIAEISALLGAEQ